MNYNYVNVNKINYIIQTKKVSRSGNGYVVRITRDLVNLLGVDENTYLELKIRKIEIEEVSK